MHSINHAAPHYANFPVSLYFPLFIHVKRFFHLSVGRLEIKNIQLFTSSHSAFSVSSLVRPSLCVISCLICCSHLLASFLFLRFPLTFMFNTFCTILSPLRSKMILNTLFSNLIILYFSPWLSFILGIFCSISAQKYVLFPNCSVFSFSCIDWSLAVGQ